MTISLLARLHRPVLNLESVRAIARFRFDKPDEKFSLFAPHELAALDARFNADLAAISALGCRLIKAEPRSADAQEGSAEGELDSETEFPTA